MSLCRYSDPAPPEYKERIHNTQSRRLVGIVCVCVCGGGGQDLICQGDEVSWDVKHTTHLHLGPMSTMRGALPPHHVYAFLA
jgi:hypothetical protein